MPILGDFVQLEADAFGLQVWWCLRTGLTPDTVAFLAEQDLPLSVGFREVEPPKITGPFGGTRRHVEQRSIHLNHVAVVAGGAYPDARLRRLIHA